MKRFAPTRRGSILLLVLVMVPALALAAYSFTHWMRAEARGSVAALSATQAQWLAHSGIEYVQAVLSDPARTEPGAEDLENNLQLFSRIVVAPQFRSQQGFFSIVAPSLVPQSSEIRYGLMNESAKIPLHRRRYLLQGKIEEQRERLLVLPNMTPELADCLLDWIDKDNETRPFGAEADYYLSLPQPYSPRNAAPRTMGELLLVRGVTAWHLYGEDANLDGILNPSENDGDRSWPPDNADGNLDRGWFPFLTIYSATLDTNPDGEAKIDLNSDLTSSQAKLVELFGQEWFDFVTQWKVANAGKKLRAVSDLIDLKIDQKNQQDTPAATPALAFLTGGDGKGEKKPQVTESPWKSQNVSEYLDQALDYLTVDAPKKSGIVRGKVDVTRAPLEVLRTMPGLKEGTADSMAGAAQGRTAGDRTPAWLLTDGIVSLDEFRKIETLVTTRSLVYRVESVGYLSQPGPTARVEAIVDATQSPARILHRRELISVGSSYPHELLLNGTTSMLNASR